MSIEYDDALKGIMEEVEKVGINIDRNSSRTLSQIGAVVAVEAARAAPRSEEDVYYYKGKPYPNTHIKDDVEFKVKNKRKAGRKYVSIGGGKKTYAKWHLASDGHVAENGRMVQGNHFVEKAVVNSEEKVDAIVDTYLKGAIDG